MEPFYSVSLFDFMERFKTDEDCMSYLAYHKWIDGFTCPECGHQEAWAGPKPYTKRCKSCRKVDSATSNTHFHKVKFGLRKAFLSVFEMSTTTKSISANHMSKRLSIKYEAAWLFMQKIRDVMESSGQYPLTGDVIVDEFVIGGYEKGAVGRKTKTKKKVKVVVAIETHNNVGVKRGYALTVDNYNSNELRKIFDRHIDKSANVITDKFRGYLPLQKEYNIKQVKSKKGNFVPMNRFIQGLKSWLRGIHHHVDEYHIQAYLNEYCYRFNRNFMKDTVFHWTIMRMIE